MADQQRFYGNGAPLQRPSQPFRYPNPQKPLTNGQPAHLAPHSNPQYPFPVYNDHKTGGGGGGGGGDALHQAVPSGYMPYPPQLPSYKPPLHSQSQPVTMGQSRSVGHPHPQPIPSGNGPGPGPMPGPYPNQLGPIEPRPNVQAYNINNQQHQQHQQHQQQHLASAMERMSVTQHGFNRLWGTESVDLLSANVLPSGKVTHPPIRLSYEFLNDVNCDQDTFCCTMNKVPESNSLLQKSRLPLGILIHPFRDLCDLSVVQTNNIVRCRSCRTYINPFVYFIDNKRWKCNLCFRSNDLPDEFQYDPSSKTYGDPSKRPEVRSCSIEYIAPSEYMLRPPQPAIYLFLLDVSRWACDSGYLRTLSETLIEEIDYLPGDARTQLGFILFDSSLHFLSITDGASQARELIVSDIDDIFLPIPDSILINLTQNRQPIIELLEELPLRYRESYDDGSALGAALQAAHKLLGPTGGRITVFQGCLPNRGPGALHTRDGPSDTAKEATKLGPQTDFYKRLALECSSQQIAVDLFLVSAHHADLATIAGMSQFSAGSVHQFPHFRVDRSESRQRLQRVLRRYLTRKIGFEAVMRVRCSRGLTLHTFHGNCFVRSTDLLSLPNISPDAGFGLQVVIDEPLNDLNCVFFQAALLYTSSKGERRIRVHTLCLPVANTLSDVLSSGNQRAIISLLGKMAVDRSLSASVADAREAFINASVDILSAYKLVETNRMGGLTVPNNLALIPLYILALLKSIAFRPSPAPRLDDRVFAMLQMKTLPVVDLIQYIYPDLYNITNIQELDPENPERLPLSSGCIDSRCVYLLNCLDVIYVLIGDHVTQDYLKLVLGPETVAAALKDDVIELAEDTPSKLKELIEHLQHERAYPVVIRVLRSPTQWIEFLVNDKTESSFSYHELLNHIRGMVK